MRQAVVIALALASAVQAAWAQSGTLKLFFQRVPVGEETYVIEGNRLQAHFAYTERASTIKLEAELRWAPDLTPTYFDIHGHSYRPFSVNATVTPAPGQARPFFTVAGYTPLSVQMMMMRYWLSHGRPVHIKQLPTGDDIEIRATGSDRASHGVSLRRYAVSNIVWGNEALWLDPNNDLAAAVTYAGNLPLEATRPEYAADLSHLIASAVHDRLDDLRAIAAAIPPERDGAYAIVHAFMIDGNGGPPIADATVVVRHGRIAAAGPAADITVPANLSRLDAHGQTLLPGLWEMHAHFAQVEYGPAYLAAGVTTARDCGGEFGFLTAIGDLLNRHGGLGPHLLRAGLIDGSTPTPFTTNWADTPEQGVAMVAKYNAAGFNQIKIYDQIQPPVLRAITAEAHRRGMTVTGHIPHGMTAFQGVEDGMDQINHLGYVTQEVRAVGLDAAVAFFKQHGTVIDPTLAWGELLAHPADVPIASFEPGFARAPLTLQTMIGSATGRGSRLDSSFATVRALYKAGVPLVAGTDKSVPAVSLHRELELYVRAGLTPMEVIDLATSGSAKVMGMQTEVGTITAGKRADMILVDGNPLENFAALRQVRQVITNGRLYSTGPLWRSVGFKPLP
ncbi:MAG TPA: amidohydrolase family protein [Terriglobales bacterium]|nr:amidohydrolase family protein [Terriglobales bacterium]